MVGRTCKTLAQRVVTHISYGQPLEGRGKEQDFGMVPVFWELLLSLEAHDLMCRYVSRDFEQALAWGTLGRRSSRNPRRSVSSWPNGFKFILSVIHTRALGNRKWLVVGMVG